MSWQAVVITDATPTVVAVGLPLGLLLGALVVWLERRGRRDR